LGGEKVSTKGKKRPAARQKMQRVLKEKEGRTAKKKVANFAPKKRREQRSWREKNDERTEEKRGGVRRKVIGMS